MLVGTQMVAKGHDFPDVALGVVLDADATLRFPDFRAEERTFALVAQLAGRSGRGDARRRVLVQTLAPEAAAIRHAARHDAAGFLAGELERRARARLPAVLAPDPGRAHRRRTPSGSTRAAERCARARRRAAGGRRALGPAPRFRLRGRERRQMLVKAREPRAPPSTAVRAAVEEAAVDARACARSRSPSTSTRSSAALAGPRPI